MKNPMSTLEPRRVLARFGLEPRRSAGEMVGTGAGLVGVGLALGAGGYWLLQHGGAERLSKLLRSTRREVKTALHR